MNLVNTTRELPVSSVEEMNDFAAQSGRDAFYSQLGIGDTDWEYREGVCNSWAVVKEKFPVPLSLTTNFIPGHVGLGLFVSPLPSSINGMELRSHSLMLSMPDTRVDFISQSAGDLYLVHIPEADLEKQWVDVYRALKKSIERSQVYVCTSRADTGALRCWFENWASAMPGQNKTAQSGLTSRLHEIVYAYMRLILRDLQRQAGNSKSYSERSLAEIRRLIEYFHTHPKQRLSTAAMARLTGLRQRNFYYRFKKYTGFSPQHYFSRIKLSYLQRELVSGTQSVAALAAKYKFHHPGEFSAFYREVYGELPSVTLKKASTHLASNN